MAISCLKIFKILKEKYEILFGFDPGLIKPLRILFIEVPRLPIHRHRIIKDFICNLYLSTNVKLQFTYQQIDIFFITLYKMSLEYISAIFFSRQCVAPHLSAVVPSAIKNRTLFSKNADVILHLQYMILLKQFNLQSCLALRLML